MNKLMAGWKAVVDQGRGGAGVAVFTQFVYVVYIWWCFIVQHKVESASSRRSVARWSTPSHLLTYTLTNFPYLPLARYHVR